MDPKLISMAGPLEGTIIKLTEPECTIGRDASNQIFLLDPSVSRNHCSILKDGEEFQVFDQGSTNCTYVNGVPIKQHVLKSGDRVRVGDSVFLFVIDENARAAAESPVQLNDEKLIAKNTLQLSKDVALRFETEQYAAVAPSRSTRDLNSLLKLSLEIHSIRNLESFGEQLLNLIFEVIPASRGVIVLMEEKAEEPSFVFGLHRNAAKQAVRVSRTVLDQVLGDGIALMSNDVMADQKLRGANSLVWEHIQALLAVPLVGSEKTLGLIYVDTTDATAHFDKDHLQMLRAIGAIAAISLENIRRVDRLENENRRLQAELAIEHDMIGNSPRMREVYQFIGKAAPTESTVLIRGESGTGKELAARAIHLNSRRSRKPFLAINCAALTDTLLESELFGHEKGAFTGAVATKKGKLEVAEGGTVFLDELGEMALPLQAKLLRVLQEHEFERVGGTRTIKTDIRLIAATNRNLEQAIKDGRFREDLYYRLNVLRLNLPPLRDRREDIPQLAVYFAEKYAQRCNRPIKGISPQAQACLLAYEWPGNVREFENAIERAVVLGSMEFIQAEDLPENIIETVPSTATTTASRGDITNFYEAVKEAKKRLIIEAFEKAQGSYTETARLLDMHPNHLHRLIRNLDMKGDLKK